MQLVAVLGQLARPDPDPAIIRPLWMDRQRSALGEALDRLAEIAARDAAGASAIRRAFDSASPQRVGLALTTPCCLWGLRHEDWRVARRELALAAADVDSEALDHSLRHVLEVCLAPGDRRVLVQTHRCCTRDSRAEIVPARLTWSFVQRGCSVIAGDSLLQSEVVDAYPQLDERDGLDSFCSVLYAAFDQLTAVAPGFVSSIRGLLRVVVPMRRPPHGVPSSSSNAMPGAIWLTDHDDPAIVAEQVVHECTHALLFLCQELDPLIDPEAHGDGWAGDLVYSPWRDDPRPVAGLLHGVAVFTRVAMCHSARREHSQTSCRRLAALLPQLNVANELLAGVRMTDAGDALRTNLSQRIQELSTLASKVEYEVPQYLECSSLPYLDGSASRRQSAHRAGARCNPAAAVKVSR
jgi:hypothetical protein